MIIKWNEQNVYERFSTPGEAQMGNQALNPSGRNLNIKFFMKKTVLTKSKR